MKIKTIAPKILFLAVKCSEKKVSNVRLNMHID